MSGLSGTHYLPDAVEDEVVRLLDQMLGDVDRLRVRAAIPWRNLRL